MSRRTADVEGAPFRGSKYLAENGTNKMAASRSESARSTVSSKSGSKMQNVERQLTIMLVSVSFAFLVLTLPQFVRYVIYSIVDHNTSNKREAVYYLMYHLSNKLYITNSSVNFYVYCISGSKFRKDLTDMLVCMDKKASESSGSTASMDSTTTRSVRFYHIS